MRKSGSSDDDMTRSSASNDNTDLELTFEPASETTSDESASENLRPQTLEIALSILEEKSHPPQSRLNAILYTIEHLDVNFYPHLNRLLDDEDEHPDVRNAAALALGKLGGDKAYESLVNKLSETSSDTKLKSYIMEAFGMMERAEAIPFLIQALESKNNDIFAKAAEAIGKMGRPAVPHLIKLLEEGAPDARCVAAWQLGELRDLDAIPPLIKTIQHDDETHDVKALCIWALGEIGYGPEDVMDILNWARNNDDPAINERANMAIKKITRHTN